MLHTPLSVYNHSTGNVSEGRTVDGGYHKLTTAIYRNLYLRNGDRG